ncbi:MAG: tRNA (adenosine(37)-N6)-threonylcarbamoyltransferase complex dimerization subunit type 1 TsaB [Prevotellaceae bacterium]|jgi:tRNA threonylcarbamoyladenosine biosynthesis protein TsaB|nr:tRNA (adenosine(37)-N6)-threonylcarbamoyltransferase complex dimerization subunit type 1 TsaB [Prevotellaceae bacterium]
MALLLCIESSAEVCSVALARNGETLVLKESALERDHAKLLAPFIASALGEAGIAPQQLDAVAVSKGPGSYTSLRIGTSVAKGLCYGAGKPLVAVGSLHALAALAVTKPELHPNDVLRPLLDARRMEVYTALFDAKGAQLAEVTAQVVDENSFAEELKEGRVVFFGSGIDKCRQVVRSANAVFVEVQASASSMVKLAEQLFAEKHFEDVAYFEPFYLKNFVAIKSTKKLL